MHVIMCQLSIVTEILAYIDYNIYFFIASINFLGGCPLRKSELPWRLTTVKENYNFLVGEGQPRKQQLSWRSRVFPWRLSTLKKINLLGGC